MGMTIDEAKMQLSMQKFYVLGKDYEAVEVALDTMRKYQKIQKIMDELNGNFYGSYLKDRQTLEKIYEVIEDGQNIIKD